MKNKWIHIFTIAAVVSFAGASHAGTAWYWGDGDSGDVLLGGGDGYEGYTYFTENASDIDVVGYYAGSGGAATGYYYYGYYGPDRESYIWALINNLPVEAPVYGDHLHMSNGANWGAEVGFTTADTSGWIGLGVGSDAGDYVFFDARLNLATGDIGWYDWWEGPGGPAGGTALGATINVTPSTVTALRLTKVGDICTIWYSTGGTFTAGPTIDVSTQGGSWNGHDKLMYDDGNITTYVSLTDENSFNMKYFYVSGSEVPAVNDAKPGIFVYGTPPTAGTVRNALVGSNVTLNVSNAGTATDGDFSWTFDGGGGPVAIGGETNGSLSLTNVDMVDSGTYVASFDNGATRAAATYTVTLNVVTSLPSAGNIGMVIAILSLSLVGVFYTRRRRATASE